MAPECARAARHLTTAAGRGAPSGLARFGFGAAILNWWYAHNLFGLWLTPMLLALTYYMVPRITNTPLYSYTLSLISFWGMAFFYTGDRGRRAAGRRARRRLKLSRGPARGGAPVCDTRGRGRGSRANPR
jgi:hypothetical protein